MIRKAVEEDLPSVLHIYDAVLTMLENENSQKSSVGWIRGIYPTEQTAVDALKKDSLFVYEAEGKIVATAKIDQTQVPVYADCAWEYQVPDKEVMVLHTLAVDPACVRRGYGREFVGFYEQYALSHGCHYLRMDTNEINKIARKMYRDLGYKEAGIVPCEFNGIPDVMLVCLEKTV